MVTSLLRLLLLEAMLCLPLAGLGWLLSGRDAALAAIAFVLILTFVVSTLTEVALTWNLNARRQELPGMKRSIFKAHRGSRDRAIQVHIIPTPAPTVLIGKALFGRGSVFIGQGALAFLTEEELRAVLAEATRRCNESGVVLRSLTSVLASFFSLLVPRTLDGLSPAKALGVAVFHSTSQSLLKVGGGRPGPSDPSVAHALQKIRQASAIWPGPVSRTLRSLQLFA